jgi:hypothetical protein
MARNAKIQGTTMTRQQQPSGDVDATSLRRRWTLMLIAELSLLMLGWLSCAGFMELSKIASKGLEPWLHGAAVAFPLLCLIGAVVLLVKMPRRSRAQAVADRAERLGLRFEAKPQRAQFQGLQSLRCLAGGWSWGCSAAAANLVTGEIDGTQVWIVDYSTHADFASGKTDEQTVFCLPHAAAGAPDFVITPRRWADTLAEWSGKHSVALPGREDFLRRFVVGGEDPDAVQRWLSREFLDAVEDMGNLTLEVKDGDLVALRYDQVVPAKTWTSLVANLRHLAELLGTGHAKPVEHRLGAFDAGAWRNEQIREGPAPAEPGPHHIFRKQGSAEPLPPGRPRAASLAPVDQPKPAPTGQQGAWGRFSQDKFTWFQTLGAVIFFLTSGIPGLEMAGFGTGLFYWSMPTALLISVLGGLVGGCLLGGSNRVDRVAGLLGGLVGGPGGLLAVHYYVLGRTLVLWNEIIIVQALGSLPGLGVYYLVKFLWNKVILPLTK